MIGRKFLKSVVSGSGFLSSGVTCPLFMDCGNVAVRKELLATLVIMTASSSLNAFMMAVGRMSNGDVFAGADSISFITSAMMTVINVSSVPSTDAGM